MLIAFDFSSWYAKVVYAIGGLVTIVTLLQLVFGAVTRMWHYIHPAGVAEQQREHDARIVREIRDLLPRNTVTELLRQHDFGGAWRVEWMTPIYDLARRNDVEDRFISGDLERLRAALHEKLADLRHLFTTQTFRSENSVEWQDVGVVPMGPDDRETRLWEERHERLNEVATEVADAFDALMEEAHRRALLE